MSGGKGEYVALGVTRVVLENVKCVSGRVFFVVVIVVFFFF